MRDNRDIGALQSERRYMTQGVNTYDKFDFVDCGIAGEE
jgi:hypothetical protein